MSIVELIPLNKGKQFILDDIITTTIGRTPNTGCLDNKISRNHAQLFIKSDGTVWIKSIHHNPTFYKTKSNEIVSLTKNKEYQLFDNDQFGLLPDEYFYRVSIKSRDEEKEIKSNQNEIIDSSTIPKSPVRKDEIIESSTTPKSPVKESIIIESSTTSKSPVRKNEINEPLTIPKSPVKENEVLTMENDDEKKSQSTLEKTQTEIFDDISSTSVTEEKSSSIPHVRKRIRPGESTTKQIVYGDDDDDIPTTTTASSSVEPKTSNDNNLDTASQVSSTVDVPNKRKRCPFGATCYRTNPLHRQENIHPGDSDWEDEENNKNKAKPICPYGNECYRKNPDHFNEYEHPKKRCIEIKTKRRSSKRKSIEEDDDGLPNEYDYNDSFIDDEDLGTTDESSDEEETDDDDDEWKPRPKNSQHMDEIDDDSTDESDKELTKKEADEFVKGSNADHNVSTTKKFRFDDE